MKHKSFKRVLALLLAAMMMLTACGQKETTTSESKASESTAASESKPSESAASSEAVKEEVKPEDYPVITLFPKDGNLFSGLVTGHRAEYFAEEGGFQLEVWAYSDEKKNAMLTSGDLPDMMYLGKNSGDLLETLIDTGKIINYDDYKEYLPNFFENPYNENVPTGMETIRETYSAGTGGLYVLPVGLGNTDSMYAQKGTFERLVVKVKWDVYTAIGAPEITDMWQLLDVLEDMVEYAPTAEDGTKIYAMYLDNTYDDRFFGCMDLWFQWHGIHGDNFDYFTEQNIVHGTVKSIFDDDSVYKEGVKWYNEAYRRGLMDPDSISTPRSDQQPKVDAGYAMVSAGTVPAWDPLYYEVFIPGNTIVRTFTTKQFSKINNCIVINAESEHIEECLAFINMLADPYAWLNINYGPSGDIWEENGNVITITDRFAEWLKENGGINSYPMSDGTEFSIWNTPAAVQSGTTITGYVGADGNPIPITPTRWPDAQAITNTDEGWLSWKELNKAEDLWDYAAQHDITIYTGDVFEGVALPEPTEEQRLKIATIKDIVVPATWKCIYAETDEEFDAIWNQMVEDAMTLGAQEIIDWMKENYKPSKEISTSVTKESLQK